MLPTAQECGETGTWVVPDVGEITGRFVGYGTSRSPYHSAHGGGYAPAGQKCQACRWMEIRVFDDGEMFAVVYEGRSEVPGESQRYWSSEANTEDDLVDLLSGEGDRGRFFSKPARMVIESAQKLMPEIGDAYGEHPGHPVRAR